MFGHHGARGVLARGPDGEAGRRVGQATDMGSNVRDGALGCDLLLLELMSFLGEIGGRSLVLGLHGWRLTTLRHHHHHLLVTEQM